MPRKIVPSSARGTYIVWLGVSVALIRANSDSFARHLFLLIDEHSPSLFVTWSSEL